MGADSFPGSNSIGIEVRVKFTEIVFNIQVCFETIRLKNESLKREVRKDFGQRFRLVADRVLPVAKDIKLSKGKL